MTVKKDGRIILYDSDEAATFVTGISGWVSRQGHFWGEDEHMARFDGATHRKCPKCGGIYRINSYCSPCAERREEEKFKAMPRREWGGEGMVYSRTRDEFFSSWDDVADCCDNEDCPMESLQLIICEPVYARTVDEDYWGDELPEDMHLDDCDSELAELVDGVNKYILEHRPILSWRPGEFALELPKGEAGSWAFPRYTVGRPAITPMTSSAISPAKSRALSAESLGRNAGVKRRNRET